LKKLLKVMGILALTLLGVIVIFGLHITGIDLAVPVRPPGNYQVLTDEELIEGLSFSAYHRVSTVIFVPVQSGSAVEMVTIDPLDLKVAQEQDAEMTLVSNAHLRSGRGCDDDLGLFRLASEEAFSIR
jgi:hypothetical protein